MYRTFRAQAYPCCDGMGQRTLNDDCGRALAACDAAVPGNARQARYLKLASLEERKNEGFLWKGARSIKSL